MTQDNTKEAKKNVTPEEVAQTLEGIFADSVIKIKPPTSLINGKNGATRNRAVFVVLGVKPVNSEYDIIGTSERVAKAVRDRLKELAESCAMPDVETTDWGEGGGERTLQFVFGGESGDMAVCVEQVENLIANQDIIKDAIKEASRNPQYPQQPAGATAGDKPSETVHECVPGAEGGLDMPHCRGGIVE